MKLPYNFVLPIKTDKTKQKAFLFLLIYKISVKNISVMSWYFKHTFVDVYLCFFRSSSPIPKNIQFVSAHGIVVRSKLMCYLDALEMGWRATINVIFVSLFLSLCCLYLLHADEEVSSSPISKVHPVSALHLCDVYVASKDYHAEQSYMWRARTVSRVRDPHINNVTCIE